MSVKEERVQEILEEQKWQELFCSAIKRSSKPYYLFDREFLCASETNETMENSNVFYLRTDIFVKTVLGPGVEVTPLIILFALNHVCEEFGVAKWGEYTTKECVQELLDRAKEMYETLDEE